MSSNNVASAKKQSKILTMIKTNWVGIVAAIVFVALILFLLLPGAVVKQDSFVYVYKNGAKLISDADLVYNYTIYQMIGGASQLFVLRDVLTYAGSTIKLMDQSFEAVYFGMNIIGAIGLLLLLFSVIFAFFKDFRPLLVSSSLALIGTACYLVSFFMLNGPYFQGIENGGTSPYTSTVNINWITVMIPAVIGLLLCVFVGFIAIRLTIEHKEDRNYLKNEKELSCLDALLIALADPIKTQNIINESRDIKDATLELARAYGCTDEQSHYILKFEWSTCVYEDNKNHKLCVDKENQQIAIEETNAKRKETNEKVLVYQQKQLLEKQKLATKEAQ